MSMPSGARPAKLYRYLPRERAERALSKGEFRLRPSSSANPAAILPFAATKAAPTFLLLSWSMSDSEAMYADFPTADTCLVVHDTELLGERIHRAVARLLPDWAGIDAAVSYGIPSPLGAAFSKERALAHQKEWLLAWRPRLAMLKVEPVTISIGSIEAIAEIRQRGA